MNTGLPSPLEGASLDDPALHAWLRNYVRRRVPADETDDLVQAVLCAALEARQRPTDGVGLRRWLTGVARHLIARHYEANRTAPRDGDDERPELAQAPPPFEERELVRWAEMQAEAVAHGPETLDWMAREGDGEKLEAIAREAELPSARVRQRVSRLRRWMKGRYLAELALASTFVLALGLWLARRKEADRPRLTDDLPAPTASTIPVAEVDQAVREQREAAAKLCERQDWAGCLEALDAAKRIDPAGDDAPAVAELRRTAALEVARAQAEQIAPAASAAPKDSVGTTKVAPRNSKVPPASIPTPPPTIATPPLASPPPTSELRKGPVQPNYKAAPAKAADSFDEPFTAKPPSKGKPQAPDFDSVKKKAAPPANADVDLPQAY